MKKPSRPTPIAPNKKRQGKQKPLPQRGAPVAEVPFKRPLHSPRPVPAELHYYKVYKPFNVLSQFTPEKANQDTLSDLHNFPKDVYAVGRLDADSEGLLLLTNDVRLNAQLLDPMLQHEREYYVQVEGEISDAAIAQLQKGVTISINGKAHQTLPAKVRRLREAPTLPDRDPPIRFRANVPTTWLSIALHEGKNRQVRRMTAAVGCPTLRLVRVRIAHIGIEGLQVGEVLRLSPNDVAPLLRK